MMNMIDSPGGGFSIFERSTRVNWLAHPARTRAAEIIQERRNKNRAKFWSGERIGVFTAAYIIPVTKDRFYRIVGPASCLCFAQSNRMECKHYPDEPERKPG